MHIHNAWLLGMPELFIDLPEEFLLFAASYLMVNDSFLDIFLNLISIASYKDNVMILPTLQSSMILNFNLLRTTEWFQSKFPYFNKAFVDGILPLTYTQCHRRLLNFECHNKLYKQHFYHNVWVELIVLNNMPFVMIMM